MPFGTPLSDEERRLKHELLYGTGSEPPVERLGTHGYGLWDALPALPLEFGIATLPLPRKIMRDIARG
jgi:hypothetical protein